MALTLGKRKRPTEEKRAKVPKKEIGSDDDDDATARALLKKAFEAKFEPLHVQPIERKPAIETSGDEDEDGSDAESESDWSGLSGTENEVEVIEHVVPTIDSIFDGSAKKFLSSKPPTSEEDDKNKKPVKSVRTSTTTTIEEEDGGTESTSLKHDLALQRLLKESHLLDSSTFSSASSTAPEGRNRIKALDMRLQDLGAKASTLQQEKMPMHIRKGIAGKATSREASRRKEAAENGIILEKFRSTQQKPRVRRERGVGGVGIGRMKGSTLKLSSYDIRSIEGTRSPGPGRRWGKRR